MSSEGAYPSLFMSALNSQSDRTLSLCWEQHCKLLPGVQGIHANQVAVWSVDEVRPRACFAFPRVVFPKLKPDAFVLQVFRFVHNLIGCEEQARVFKEEVSGTLIRSGHFYFPTGATAVQHSVGLSAPIVFTKSKTNLLN